MTTFTTAERNALTIKGMRFDELTAQVRKDGEKRIIPAEGFPFNTVGVVWTLVGPTRYAYASVLRESNYGTVVAVNNDLFTVS